MIDVQTLSQRDQLRILSALVVAMHTRSGKGIPKDRILSELSVAFTKLGDGRFNSGQPLAEALDALIAKGWCCYGSSGYYWITLAGIEAFEAIRKAEDLDRLHFIDLQKLRLLVLEDRSERESRAIDLANRGTQTRVETGIPEWMQDQKIDHARECGTLTFHVVPGWMQDQKIDHARECGTLTFKVIGQLAPVCGDIIRDHALKTWTVIRMDISPGIGNQWIATIAESTPAEIVRATRHGARFWDISEVVRL